MLPVTIAIAAAAAITAFVVALALTHDDDEPIAGPPQTSAATSSATTGAGTPATTPATSASASTPTTTGASTLPGGIVLGESCVNGENGYSLSYPTGWYAELNFPGWTCALFDPQPFDVVPNSEIPPVAVVVSVADFPFDESLAQYTDPGMYEVLSTNDLTTGGQPVVAVEVVTISDTTPLPAGTDRYAVLFAWGKKTLIIETNSIDATNYLTAKQVVRGMADTLVQLQ